MIGNGLLILRELKQLRYGGWEHWKHQYTAHSQQEPLAPVQLPKCTLLRNF